MIRWTAWTPAALAAREFICRVDGEELLPSSAERGARLARLAVATYSERFERWPPEADRTLLAAV
jgi:hypothetical protein